MCIFNYNLFLLSVVDLFRNIFCMSLNSSTNWKFTTPTKYTKIPIFFDTQCLSVFFNTVPLFKRQKKILRHRKSTNFSHYKFAYTSLNLPLRFFSFKFGIHPRVSCKFHIQRLCAFCAFWRVSRKWICKKQGKVCKWQVVIVFKRRNCLENF